MADPIFEVEDGTGKSDANALISVDDADQIMENYSSSTDWSGVEDVEGESEEEKAARQLAAKENAIREATRYLNLHYVWDGYKILYTQACQWPRYEMYDEDGWVVASNIVPERVKEACAYLALKVIASDILLEDFDNESRVKKTKDVVGPLTEEREYVDGGESPEKTYQVVDRLIAPFTIGDGEVFHETNLERG